MAPISNSRPNLESVNKFAFQCIGATSDLYGFIAQWSPAHNRLRTAFVVHSFLDAHRLLYQHECRAHVKTYRRELTAARHARGPIQDWSGRLHVNAHEAAYETLCQIYGVVIGSAELRQDGMKANLDDACRQKFTTINGLVTSIPSEEVPWLQAQFKDHRDSIRRAVLKGPKPNDLGAEVEWEIALQEFQENPNDHHLQILPGGISCKDAAGKEITVRIGGKTLDIIRALTDAYQHQLDWTKLVQRVWGPDAFTDKATIKNAVADARDVLRKLARQAGKHIDENYDPLPCVNRGKDLAWKLDFRW